MMVRREAATSSSLPCAAPTGCCPGTAVPTSPLSPAVLGPARQFQCCGRANQFQTMPGVKPHPLARPCSLLSALDRVGASRGTGGVVLHSDGAGHFPSSTRHGFPFSLRFLSHYFFFIIIFLFIKKKQTKKETLPK